MLIDQHFEQNSCLKIHSYRCFLFLFPLLLLSCYSSPFSEIKVRSMPEAKKRYYALQIRFAADLQQYFYQRACNYSSVESWTVYFSRDPLSYQALPDFQIPSFRTMKEISDLKLFLPRGTTVLDTFHQIEFYGSFPIVTAETRRRYQLAPNEESYINKLQKELWKTGTGRKPLSSKATNENNNARETDLQHLPQVVNEKGLVQEKTHQKKNNLQTQNFSNPFYQPLQRAQSGPRFLNYMLMVGVIVGSDGKSYSSTWELWNLPLILLDSQAQFQYLGELEIGLGPNSAAKGSLLFNPLGQADLRFQVNNYLPYWKPYLDYWLGGSRFKDAEEYFAKRATPKKKTKHSADKNSPTQEILKGDFQANLLQVLNKPSALRSFPQVRFTFGQNLECRF